MNRIHHGDISFNNLMYDTSATNGPVGILNDFDLATWVDHSTTNNDRTGTIPFMAIDMLDGGLDDRIPRLYRHDVESFIWVLAYITVAKIEYKDRTIEISPSTGVEDWFENNFQADRRAHLSSKRSFHSVYGIREPVSVLYRDYVSVSKQMTRYWANFHQSLDAMKYILDSDLPTPTIIRKPVTDEPQIDDPRGSMRLFITTVEELLGEGVSRDGFAEVKALLLEAIETPIVAGKA